MDKSERLTKILEILRTEGNASTKYLADGLWISEATGQSFPQKITFL